MSKTTTESRLYLVETAEVAGLGIGYVFCNVCDRLVYQAIGVHTDQETWDQYLAQDSSYPCKCVVPD